MGVDTLNSVQMIEDIVTPFLPANNTFLYHLSATREIVNGFKYVIVFAMQNETEDEVVCEIDVIEKPWLVKNLNKYRKMIYNNCSLSSTPDDDDKMRFQYEVNPSFLNQREEMSQDDMNDLEDQIVAFTQKPHKPRTTTTTTITAETESDDVTHSVITTVTTTETSHTRNNVLPPMETTTPGDNTSPLSNMNMDALDEIFGIKKSVGNTNAAPPSSRTDESSTIDESTPDATNKSLETEIKKIFSDLFQNDPEFQNSIITLISKRDDVEAQQNVISILANKLKEKLENLSDQQTEVTDSQTGTRAKRSTNLDPIFTNEAVAFLEKVNSLKLPQMMM